MENEEIKKIEISQKDFEIMNRQAQIYQLLVARNVADQKINQLEKELAELTKSQVL